MNKLLNEVRDSLLENVNGKHLMEYTKEISKEIRLSGSEEELRSFYYVEQLLQSFGLTTKLEFHDAFISIPKHAHLSINGHSFPCITHSMAISTEENGMEAQAVYCDELDLKSKQDVKAKIAVLEGIATPYMVHMLEEMGAVGAIFINGCYTHEMTVSTVWGNPTPKTVDFLPRIPVVSMTNENGENLRKSMLSGHSLVKLKTVVETGWRKIPSLIANIKGQVESDDFVLFSGHIDSWHYGAMDNASANATMIEVARILTDNQQFLRRGVKFAFWSGHSHGRYAGSASYCDQNWKELHEHCALHVYVDSVGGEGATILSEANCMAETMELGSIFIKQINDEDFIGKRFARAGDQSFWGTGVPSLFMGLSEQPISVDPASKTLVKLFGGKKAGGFGWWWHTTEDTIDKINEENLVRDCKIYLGTIFHACSNDILPINQLAAIKEIKSSLLEYQQLAAKRFDLTELVIQISELEKLTAILYEQLDNKNYSNQELKIINKGIMRISRYLVPLNYVSGDQFDHDPAEGQLPIPMLQDIRDLKDIQIGSNEEFQIKTLLLRRKNKVSYLLNELERELVRLIHKLKV